MLIGRTDQETMSELLRFLGWTCCDTETFRFDEGTGQTKTIEKYENEKQSSETVVFEYYVNSYGEYTEGSLHLQRIYEYRECECTGECFCT